MLAWLYHRWDSVPWIFNSVCWCDMTKPRLYYSCNPAPELVFVLIVHFYRFKFVPLNLRHYVCSVCIRGFQWFFRIIIIIQLLFKTMVRWRKLMCWLLSLVLTCANCSPTLMQSMSPDWVGTCLFNPACYGDMWSDDCHRVWGLWSPIGFSPGWGVSCQFFFILFLLYLDILRYLFSFLLNMYTCAVATCFQVWRSLEEASSQG